MESSTELADDQLQSDERKYILQIKVFILNSL